MRKIKLLIVKIIFNLGHIFTLKDIVVYESFLGRRLDDNIYYLMDITRDKTVYYVTKDFNLAHACKVNNEYNVSVLKKNTLKYFWTMSRAKYIVTNSRLHIGLLKKRYDQIVVQLWHGIPWKYLAFDQKNFNFNNKDEEIYLREFAEDVEKWDYLWTPSVESKSKLSTAFMFDKAFIEKMYPADVKLIDYKSKFEVDNFNFDKVVLYMPTFRENNEVNKDGNYSPYENFNFERYARENKNVLFLVRGHYLTHLKSVEIENVIDVNDYDSLNDLYSIADILITDYSSAIYHFAFLQKPIIAVNVDINEYSKVRGLYEDAINNMNIKQVFLLDDLYQINLLEVENSKTNQNYFDSNYEEVFRDIIE